jgi:hypothetical protein
MEPCGSQRRAQCGRGHRLAVGSLYPQRTQGSIPDCQGECVGSCAETIGVVGPREQGAAAAFDVEHELAVDEHDESACLTAGSMAAGLVSVWPRQRRAVRVRRIGRREDQGRHRLPPSGSVCERAEPVDGPDRCELSGTEAGHEISAPGPPTVLERRQHAVGGREATGQSLGDDGTPGDDSMPVEQPLRGRMCPPGRIGVASRQQRPSAGRDGRSTANR